MSVYYSDDGMTVYHGDALVVLAEMPDASVDAVVTDPPYGLEFMGRDWDAPWKYGFGETGYTDGKRMPRPNHASTRNPMCRICRKHKRGTDSCRCEAPDYDETDADSARLYQAWCEQWAVECLRLLKPGGHLLAFGGSRTFHRLACAIEDAGFEIRDTISWLYGSGFPKSLNLAGDWQGWGTALKPAWEPIIMARKPLAGTVAANVIEHGAGVLNIDGCRVGDTVETWPVSRRYIAGGKEPGAVGGETSKTGDPPAGRWPANVVLDEDAAAQLDWQSGHSTSPPVGSVARTKGGNTIGTFAHAGRPPSPNGHGDAGGASRFYYTPKASADERPRVDGVTHPTVKPLDLMRWLVRLITPPAGLVLDPFAGSGTTGEACMIEGFRCVLVEREETYLPLIKARLSKPIQPTLGSIA